MLGQISAEQLTKWAPMWAWVELKCMLGSIEPYRPVDNLLLFPELKGRFPVLRTSYLVPNHEWVKYSPLCIGNHIRDANSIIPIIPHSWGTLVSSLLTSKPTTNLQSKHFSPKNEN
ncbi:hypothetical protein VNO77_16485 [Canavalia gladiata]|uniref:Uncharacterized protein n=1 Tax=Canavalia gladiata TaxID=3824 RepID=A0AAN9QS42_CANGL